MADPSPEKPVGDIETPFDLAAERIVRFEVECRLDTTITVNGNNWFKPGISSKVGWNYLPEEVDIRTAIEYMERAVLAPAIDQQVEHMSQQLAAHQRNTGGKK